MRGSGAAAGCDLIIDKLLRTAGPYDGESATPLAGRDLRASLTAVFRRQVGGVRIELHSPLGHDCTLPVAAVGSCIPNLAQDIDLQCLNRESPSAFGMDTATLASAAENKRLVAACVAAGEKTSSPCAA